MDSWQHLHDRFQAQWFDRDYASALTTATQELAAAQQHPEGDHPGLIRAWLDLGLAQQANDRPSEASQAKAEAHAVSTRLEALAAQHPDLPATADFLLFDADRLWNLEGDTPEVIAKFERAIRIREEQLGDAHADTAHAIARLAEVEDLRAHFVEAEGLYRRAMTIFEAAKSTPDPYRQKALEGLGRTLMHLDRPEEAWPVLEKALATADLFEKRPLYALLIAAAACRRALDDIDGSVRLEARALALLPKANPGAEGFHV